MQISNRLKQIAQLVPCGAKLADVGTDHAYIPTYLVKNECIDFAIATDIAKGPCKAAKATIDKENLQDKIKVIEADGLQGIQQGEVDTVIIAGMGGKTIVDILQSGKNVLKDVLNIIVQPMVQAKTVRQWLIDNSWVIVKEDLVMEDGYIYQIIFAQKAQVVEPIGRLQLEFGPIIMQNKHPLLKQLVENTINQYQTTCTNMQKSDVALQSEKYKQFSDFILQAKEFLKCL